jgi:hypothetical protein
LHFIGDADTGLYSSAANTLDWAVGGVNQMQLDSAGLSIVPNVDLTGTLTLSGAPTVDLHAATKKYVDDNAGGIPDPITVALNQNLTTPAHHMLSADGTSKGYSILSNVSNSLDFGWQFRRWNGSSYDTLLDMRSNYATFTQPVQSEYGLDYHSDSQFFTDSIGGTAVTPTGTVTWTQARGRLSVGYNNVATGDLCPRLYSLTSPAAGDFYEVKFDWAHTDTTYHHAGIMISDGTSTSSNAYAIVLYWDGTNIVFREYEGTITNMVAGSSDVLSPIGQTYYLRIEYVSSNTFLAAFSIDGVSWAAYIPSESVTLTPTHFGPCVSNWDATSDVALASFDHLIRL